MKALLIIFAVDVLSYTQKGHRGVGLLRFFFKFKRQQFPRVGAMTLCVRAKGGSSWRVQ